MFRCLDKAEHNLYVMVKKIQEKKTVHATLHAKKLNATKKGGKKSYRN